MDVVKILGLCVLGLGVVMALAGFYWVRQQIRSGQGVTYGTINSNFAFLVALIVVWVNGYSPFHLLWLFPASYIFGFLTLMPGFSLLLVPLAKLYGIVAGVGLDKEEVEANTARIGRIRELMLNGMDKEEAIKTVMSKEQGTK